MQTENCIKTKQLSHWLQENMSNNVLLTCLPKEQIREIVNQMYCIEFVNRIGHRLITQGDDGDCLYIVEKGQLLVYVDNKRVSTMGPGDIIGEISLMYNSKRTATCVTQSRHCKLWAIHRNDFRKILRRMAFLQLDSLVYYLKTNIKMFQSLSNLQIRKIAESLKTIHFKKNTEIVTQGEHGDTFYIIKSGTAVAKKKTDHARHSAFSHFLMPEKIVKDEIIDNFEPNMHFGERSLILNEPHTVTIQATSDVTCLTLSRKDFMKLFAANTTIQNVIKSKIKFYDDGNIGQSTSKRQSKLSMPPTKTSRSVGLGNHVKANTSDSSRQLSTNSFNASCDGSEHVNSVGGGSGSLAVQPQASPFVARRSIGDGWTHVSNMRRKPTDFNIIKGIGQGSFGCVYLVKDKLNKQTYALKKMSKYGIEKTQQQKHVANEVKILKAVNCEFITKLWTTFQDDYNVYLLLEIGLGGDMFTYLDTKGILSEKSSKFFVGCVVLAFEHLHSKSIVFRDLKPENLIFDFRGYLKVADFGFAKKLDKRTHYKTYTVCGTPEYIAPEIVTGQGHSFEVDWWTVGIFLYELLFGDSPFSNKGNLMKTYHSILHEHPSYNVAGRRYSTDVVDLMKKLLCKQPNKRLGHHTNDIQKLKQHQWFRGFDWQSLATGQMKSPFRPKLKGDSDIKYFDQDVKEPVQKLPKSPNAQWMKYF